MKIHTFTLRGKDIDVTHNNGFLAYTFKENDKHYGQKIKLPSKSIMDVASATFLLIENALETIEAVKKTNDNK